MELKHTYTRRSIFDFIKIALNTWLSKSCVTAIFQYLVLISLKVYECNLIVGLTF